MKDIVKHMWKYIEGINGLILALYFVFVWFTDAVVSGAGTFLYWFAALFVGGLIAIFICPIIIRCLSKVSISTNEVFSKSRGASVKTWGIFFIISFGVLFLFYICSYPGTFSTDSVSQYEQALNNQYSDWHPVLHTLIAFKLPLMLTGGWKGSIVLFQMLELAAVIAYALSVILEYTNVGFSLFSMCYILLNPQTGGVAQYPWKDVAFAIGALLTLTYALRVFVSRGLWLKNKINMVLFICAVVFTTFVRHNAILFTVPLVLAVLLHTDFKKGLALCMGILVLYAIIKVPVYSALNVEKPDQRQIETLGLPMTLIGAAVVSTPEALDDETIEFAYRVAPAEVWAEKYSPRTFNNVKWDARTDNYVIEEYGAKKVLDIMIRSGKAAKVPTLKSLILLTNTIYSVSDTSIDYYGPAVGAKRDASVVKLGELLGYCCQFISNNFYYLFNLGFVHLIIIVSALSKCKLNQWGDWKKLLFIIPVLAYNYGTTLLLTGAEDAMRFFCYTPVIVPIILVFLYRNNIERVADENV